MHRACSATSLTMLQNSPSTLCFWSHKSLIYPVLSIQHFAMWSSLAPQSCPWLRQECLSYCCSQGLPSEQFPLADAPEDVLALSSAVIDVMPSQSLRGALLCAADLLRSHRQKSEAAVKRDDNETQRLQQEVSALAASLKVLRTVFGNMLCVLCSPPRHAAHLCSFQLSR